MSATAEAPHPAQRRTLVVLALVQALVGVGNGVAVGVGSLLAEQVTGDAAFGGIAATCSVLGGAIASVPLARLAAARGRRVALAIGSLVGLAGSVLLVVGGALWSPPIVVLGFLALGTSMAVGLQSRFAATDLAEPRRRARDLSIVVWMTTIGVVAGPQLVPPGDAIGASLGLPPLVGAYVIVAATQAAAAIVLWWALRPDPLLLARAERGIVETGQTLDAATERLGVRAHPRAALAIAVIASAHATMVGIMALTPVHLGHAGQPLAIIALTMSAHTAGMYVLSPVFGMLADRVGRVPTAMLGHALLVGAILLNVIADEQLAPLALALLGLGWSAATVSGSTLLSESVPAPLRPRVQGRSDLAQGLAGAAAGAVAGPILGLVGYAGLSLVMSIAVAVGCFAALAAVRSGRAEQEPGNVPPTSSEATPARSIVADAPSPRKDTT